MAPTSEPYRNLAEMFFDRAAARTDRPRHRVKRDGAWQEASWSTVAAAVRETAAGLLEEGLVPGAKVAILAGTRPEWLEADIATYACGAITVPIYQSNLPHECGYILANSESKVCFVENAKQLAKIRAVQRDGFELDGQSMRVEVTRLILMEGAPDGERGGELARAAAADGRLSAEHKQSSTRGSPRSGVRTSRRSSTSGTTGRRRAS